MKSAFTFVELLVVMAIIAIIGGLGLQALVLFRQTIQFQQAQIDLSSRISSVYNSARNSVLPSGVYNNGNPGEGNLEGLFYGYAMYFSGGDYGVYYCSRQQSATLDQANCSNEENENAKPTAFESIEMIMENPTKCAGIFFQRRTGDIAGLSNFTSSLDQSGNCTVLVRHKDNANLNGELIIDLTNNSYAWSN